MDTCMVWGFECGEGWEPLIRRLSGKLEAAILKLPADKRSECCASQVKQKFGALRFYMDGPISDEMREWISEAEAESVVTCEPCGAPSECFGMRALCSTCSKKRK